MITLKEASQIATTEFEQILPTIESKFEKVYFNTSTSNESFYIKCEFKKPIDQIKDIIIQFISDNDRRNPKMPKNLIEYHNQGSGEKLMEKFKNRDKNAWKCMIFSNLADGKKIEYGIGINEKKFTQNDAKILFNNYLLIVDYNEVYK